MDPGRERDTADEHGADASTARRARLWTRPPRARFYVAGRVRDRRRRPTDVVLLVACLVGLLIVGQAAQPPSEIERGLIEVAAGVPDALDILWTGILGGLTLWALALIVVTLVRWRLDILRDQVLAVVVATAAAAGVTALIGESTHSFWDALTTTGPPADPVALRLALAVAVTAMSSPYIARPLRSVSRWLVLLGAVALTILGAATPSGVLLGVLCGAGAAAVVHLAFGSSAGGTDVRDVQRTLADLGIPTTSLVESGLLPAGVAVLDAVDDAGTPLIVKYYGQDAWDAQLLAKAWRALWYRDVEAVSLTRLQQVEHEAFVTALAAREGVEVEEVVRAGRVGNDAVIVLRRRGEPLAPDTDAFDPAVLDGMWDAGVRLGAAGFAHGDLAPDRFRRDGGTVVLHGLAEGSVLTSADQQRVDQAQVLVASAILAGIDTATAVALRRLGADDLAAVLPYLQVAALGRSGRAALDESPLELDDLRAHAAEAAGVAPPALAQLRRVTVGTVVQAVLMAAAAYILISTFAGVDLQQLADAIAEATFGLLVVALVVGQLPRFAMAFATRAECPRPIAYGPVALLHFAITFVNLVLPSTAARTALNVRFFERRGVPPASAMSIGVIDSLAGFVVQIAILLTVVVFGVGDLELSLSSAESGSGTLLTAIVVIGAVLVLAVLVAAIVPRLRRAVIAKVRPWIGQVAETVAHVGSPAKAVQVLGGNFVSELLFASTLGLVLLAFGSSLSLGTLLTINVCVSLFSGIMPIPGGIGVAEGALTLGLTAAGIDDATAFAVAIAYRMCTFYLPPIWGGIAFRHMERAGDL